MPATEGLDISPYEVALLEGRGRFRDVQEYNAVRQKLISKEKARYFDAPAIAEATDNERIAAAIVSRVRKSDREKIYEQAKYTHGYERYEAGPYLENLDLINQSRLLKIAQKMPKGAHLHIHFNACLPPAVLIRHALTVDSIYIKSTLNLLTSANKDACEIQFEVIKPPEKLGNLFSSEYHSGYWMKFQEFADTFPGGREAAIIWLESKVLLDENQVYGIRQSVKGIWDKFGTCTRFMKGLFAYESAFRHYVRTLIEDFVRDGIQYAEIRPNFPVNFTIRDDTSGIISTHDLCQIMIDEVEAAKAKLVSGQFFDLRVIYVAPKLPPKLLNMSKCLTETLELKKSYPNLICGFDLAGPEETFLKLHDYLPELLQFKEDCRLAGVDIPFLFHAGETLQDGTDTDANLYDCLMLGCPRIGHGYALAKHPELMEQFQKQGICLELCPISNELLHLCPSISGHAMWSILSQGVHCTLNSDNGTIFSSTLSHDFYQFLIGSNNSSIFGWKTLAKWSIEHSCLSDADKATVQDEWQRRWDEFILWIIEAHPEDLQAAEIAVSS